MNLYEKLESLYRNATDAGYDRKVIDRVVSGVLRDIDEDETDWTGDNEQLSLDAQGWIE